MIVEKEKPSKNILYKIINYYKNYNYRSPDASKSLGRSEAVYGKQSDLSDDFTKPE